MQTHDGHAFRLNLVGPAAQQAQHGSYETSVRETLPEDLYKHRQRLQELLKPLVGTQGAPKLHTLRYTCASDTESNSIYEVSRYGLLFADVHEILIGLIYGSVGVGSESNEIYTRATEEELLNAARRYLDLQGHQHNPSVRKHFLSTLEKLLKAFGPDCKRAYYLTPYRMALTILPVNEHSSSLGVQMKITAPTQVLARESGAPTGNLVQ